MAQQITIDIVAETKKLTAGVNEANSQIDSMSSKLKGAAAAAGAAASAFVLKQGVSFLKDGIDEAKEAAATMRAATATFGEGSVALKKITEDAAKFGKEIAVDNDVIIQLATQLGSRLPASAKGASAELVNLAFDIEAYTGGALGAEAVTGKLAKAFADGELTAKELTKIVPDLDDATYAMAETMSKAGDNQGALNVLIEAGQKKYGDAAESNVSASQKLDVALADLKEQIGARLLPTIEKLIGFVTTVIDKFSALPGPVQNVILALTALIAIGGPTLTFLASAKTAMVTLGLVSGTTTGAISLTTIATNLLSIALRAIPILAIIGLIVLLVKNWDTVKEVVDNVWEAIKNFSANAWNALKTFGSRVSGFIDEVKESFNALPAAMLNVGVNIVKGLWNGMQNMAGWLKDRVTGFFKNLVPSWAEKALGIASPSKVFAGIGSNIIQGLQSTFNAGSLGTVAKKAVSVPNIVTPKSNFTYSPPINITINAGLGTDPYKLGRAVNDAITKYSKVSSKSIVPRGAVL